MSISGDKSEGLDQRGEGDSIDKQRINTIRVELSAVTDGIEDVIDENEIDENSTTSEVDCKLAKLESSEQTVENFIMSCTFCLKQVIRSYIEKTKRNSCHQ